ncbi:DGAT1/2-independent enzyme synthesizing storage lipids [Atheta coriaria]|uniref:DGAT1/2-independent enzyme synthesizing storage lipids n=1 Tax=Dalotia coriaria TaxID=877792 RepID=UPI0031F45FA8
MNFIDEFKTNIYNFAVEYIDIDYSLWLSWLLMPLLITILLPLIIGVLLYLSALILYIYKLHWVALKRTIDLRDVWSTAIKLISAIWDGHGWIWHGYEVNGLDNIPKDTPALLVYYHGSIPIDAYYLCAKTYLYHNRLIRTVADKFLFKVPGFPIIADACKVIPGTIQSCSAILKENHLLAISPGGVYEAQFSSSSTYNILWKKRLGFAKVAIDAKCPIIPVFTENIKEAFRNAMFGSLGRKFYLKLYTWTKFPCSWAYGGFPVKLVTHIGTPIPYDPALSPEELQIKIMTALNDLIMKHQRLPGSISHALLDRIPYFRRKHKQKQEEKLKNL